MRVLWTRSVAGLLATGLVSSAGLSVIGCSDHDDDTVVVERERAPDTVVVERERPVIIEREKTVKHEHKVEIDDDD